MHSQRFNGSVILVHSIKKVRVFVVTILTWYQRPPASVTFFESVLVAWDQLLTQKMLHFSVSWWSC